MYIYKFIDEYGTLIYVGITKNKNRRVSQHIKADLKRINDARYIYYSYHCDKYGASYHVVANPSKVDGVCDSCGGELMIRKDDAPETVRRRLEVYHEQTEVLKDFYAKLGKLRLVDGGQSIQDANEEILKAIGAKV